MAIEYIARASKEKLPPREKFILIALANYANDDAEAWPKQSTLSEWTGYSRQTVCAALAELERLRIIESRERRYSDGRNASKVYRLIFQRSVNEFDSGRTSVNETDSVSVNEVDSVSVNEVDNKKRQHRNVNIEPTTTTPKLTAEQDSFLTGLYGGLSGPRLITELSKRNKHGSMLLEKVSRCAKWNFGQKLEAAELFLEHPEPTATALNETFDRLENLRFTFKFFKKVVERQTTPTPPPDQSKASGKYIGGFIPTDPDEYVDWVMKEGKYAE